LCDGLFPFLSSVPFPPALLIENLLYARVELPRFNRFFSSLFSSGYFLYPCSSSCFAVPSEWFRPLILCRSLHRCAKQSSSCRPSPIVLSLSSPFVLRPFFDELSWRSRSDNWPFYPGVLLFSFPSFFLMPLDDDCWLNGRQRYTPLSLRFFFSLPRIFSSAFFNFFSFFHDFLRVPILILHKRSFRVIFRSFRPVSADDVFVSGHFLRFARARTPSLA